MYMDARVSANYKCVIFYYFSAIYDLEIKYIPNLLQ